MNAKIRIAYYVPGLGWKQRTFATQAALERFLDERPEISEVRYRKAARTGRFAYTYTHPSE